MVVEDDAGVRSFLSRGLRLHGFDVVPAAGGEEAVEIYRRERQRIGAVLLDVQMPDLDGPWTLIALRGIDADVRCCFMSGNSGDYTAEMLQALGVGHILQKPFRLAEAVRAIHDILTPPE